MNIHSTAQIHPSAELGEDVSIGPFSIVEADARIGKGTEIGSNAIIHKGARIGEKCRIYHSAAIGGDPQIFGFDINIPSFVEVGSGTTMREYVTINRSGKENQATVIGKDCMLMAYAHVAHDCILGNGVIVVNGTGLSGHVEVGDNAFISGLSGIHQFVRIGKCAMIGGVTAITQDILPYSLVEGRPPRLVGINSVGLRRRNITPAARSCLKQAVKLLKQSDLNTAQAVDRIASEIDSVEEIRYLVDFINSSSRGITK
ncbi:MAG: acyl-ACP--UDP-N-acetylglucosamine O-acyltransferase [Candidatus Nitrohelix vancouverensis]|uniref:Acyl-ACP--UDP-N-acetylglucosamine O-acyltransferase n=1 Tax=Candidatus Nitrohelix vancouverensis TaxID=2705534 RepID=A0A7T0C050_9BACT|nr:MAG: acyl-ACP--UDP-N-acetylglucosamine O-acyltransferase [Candidatus Nitrohelix vancouverensis]